MLWKFFWNHQKNHAIGNHVMENHVKRGLAVLGGIFQGLWAFFGQITIFKWSNQEETIIFMYHEIRFGIIRFG